MGTTVANAKRHIFLTGPPGIPLKHIAFPGEEIHMYYISCKCFIRTLLTFYKILAKILK